MLKARMKYSSTGRRIAWAAALGTLVLLGGRMQVHAVEIGDSLETVIAALGPPRSSIQIGDRHALYYERGHVELLRGSVVEVLLISEEEAEARRIRNEQERVRLAQEAMERRLALEAEGRALRDSQLADAAFLAESPHRRVSFWQSFARRFPGVELPLDYDDALQLLRVERELARAREEEAHRVDLLESRIREAELRADLAEDAARRAARRGWRYHPVVPLVPVTHVVVSPRHPREDWGSESWRRNARSTPGRAIGVPPVHAPLPSWLDEAAPHSRVRPRGYHNAQVHNRALAVPCGPAVHVAPFHSSPGFGFQHPRTARGGLSSISAPAPLPPRGR